MNEKKLNVKDENEESDLREESALDFSDELVDLIRTVKDDGFLREKLSDYHANDVAAALEQLTLEERKRVYSLLGDEFASDVLSYAEDTGELIDELSPDKAADIIENMDADDAVDVLEELDEDKKREILALMEQDAAEDVKLISTYDEDQIGSEMTTNFIEIKSYFSVKQAMRELIKQAANNDNISTVYVSDEKNVFCGAIELRDLFIARDTTPLSDIIISSYPYLYASDKISDCVEKIKDYAEDSLPVLNADNELIGAFTSSSAVSVIESEMSEDYAKLAGLSGSEESGDGVFNSLLKRLPWIIALLGFSLLISAIIGAFEKVIQSLPLIVFFQSLVLDMGGNSGTQTLGVTLQNLAENDDIDPRETVWRETRVSFLSSLISGLIALPVLSAYMALFKAQSFVYALKTSACISGALIIAMTVSGFCGAAVPLFFKKLKKDPAAASGPLITTVNDLVSAVTFYTLAWLFLIVL